MFNQRARGVIAPIILAVLFNTGCENTRITTTIFSDGSLQRQITVKSGSADIFDNAFAYPDDGRWTVEIETVNTEVQSPLAKQKRYIHKRVRHYATIDEMNADFSRNREGDLPRLRPRAILEKKFRGFFTTYRYSETYAQYFPFQRVPPETIFSDEEIALIQRLIAEEPGLEEKVGPGTLDDLERRFIYWYNSAAFADFMYILKTRFGSTAGFNQEQLDAGQEHIARMLMEKKEHLDTITAETLATLLAGELNRPEILEIVRKNPEAFAQIEKKGHLLDTILLDEFSNQVTMPGIIVASNAQTVSGRSAGWDFGAEAFLLTDFTMWMESRSINLWFVILTAVIILAALATLIVQVKRKKRI